MLSKAAHLHSDSHDKDSGSAGAGTSKSKREKGVQLTLSYSDLFVGSKNQPSR